MARVLIRTQAWGTVQSRSGDALPSLTYVLKNTDGSAATHWSAETGGSSSTASLTTDANGGAVLSGADRWIEQGEYDLTTNANTYRVSTSVSTAVVTASASDKYGRTQAITRIDGARAGMPDTVSIQDAPFNAKCDGVLTHGQITTGTAAFTSTVSGSVPAVTFQTTDVGKLISVPGAGAAGADLVTTIASVSAGTANCTLTATAGTSVSGALVFIASDDRAAINATLAAVIPIGGTILLPPGYIGISGTVDFGAMATVAGGQFRPITVQGAGGSVNDSIGQGTTAILNFGAGIALKSWTANVMGLHYKDFVVRNVTDIGQGVFTIDWSMVMASASMTNVRVFGRGDGGGGIGTRPNVGNGIRVDNPQVGQHVFNNVIADRFDSPPSGGFKGSEGFRFGAESSPPGGGSGANSGNSVFNGLKSSCTVGFRLINGALYDGACWTAPKCVMNGGGGNIGWLMEPNHSAHVINAPHVEGYKTALWFNGSRNMVVNGALLSIPAGSASGDGSTAVLFDNSAPGNQLWGADIGGAGFGFDIGVKESGGATGNAVRCQFGVTPYTSKFVRNGANDTWEITQLLRGIGLGSPESVVTAGLGATYQRLDGAGGTSLYVKENGTGNTGWSVKQDKDDGQPGLLVPSSRAVTTLTPTASKAWFLRFVPSRRMSVTLIAFNVITAASVNDNVDAGLFTVSGVTLALVASAGSTAGKVNATGMQTLPVVATLTAGTIYYVGFAYGTIGGTAAVVAAAGLNSARNAQFFGTASGLSETFTAAQFPLATAPTLGIVDASFPILAVRES